MSRATYELLQRGRLEQLCPVDCHTGWRRTSPGPEAAGAYCSACGTPTGLAHWRIPDTTRRAANAAKARAVTAARRGSRQEETGHAPW